MASDNAKVLFLDAFDAQSDKAMKARILFPWKRRITKIKRCWGRVSRGASHRAHRNPYRIFRPR